MSTASSDSAAHATARPAGSSAFLRARLASFLAILPLGVWTLIHLWNNLTAFQGPEAWERAVTHYPHPIAHLATSIVVLLPLALHTVWGLGRLLTARPNNHRYNFYDNFKYLLQRLSAVGVLLFIGAHIYQAMLRPRLETGKPEPFVHIAEYMHSHTPTLVVYILGVLGVAYHLANGVQTFAMGWGIVASRKALKRLEWFSLALFAILLLMGYAAIYALYEAGRTAS